jgi:hypothetical protein
MLTRPRRLPQPEPAPGILAATVAELPELDGTHITILGLHHSTIVGLHNSATQTIVHTLVTGVTPEDHWTYGRGVRPLPALWVRDSSGRWHATRAHGGMPSGNNGEVIVWFEIVPPLDRGTAWIDLVATGRSAGVRVRLPLCWDAKPLTAIPGFPALTASPESSSPARWPRWTPGHPSAGPCRISWTASPPKLPESSATPPANPAKSRSHQALKP